MVNHNKYISSMASLDKANTLLAAAEEANTISSSKSAVAASSSSNKDDVAVVAAKSHDNVHDDDIHHTDSYYTTQVVEAAKSTEMWTQSNRPRRYKPTNPVYNTKMAKAIKRIQRKPVSLIRRSNRGTPFFLEDNFPATIPMMKSLKLPRGGLLKDRLINHPHHEKIMKTISEEIDSFVCRNFIEQGDSATTYQ